SARGRTGIFVKSDNNKRFFTSFTDKDGKTLTPSEIYDIVEDNSGTVWIGTDVGPILLNNLNKIFDASYRCTRVKIPRDDGTGLADYLLDGIPVRAIDVDGGNRKWIGTTNGVYLVSADGLTTYNHFTEDNSPLISNEITSLEVNNITGSVLIGSGNGIVEYRDGVTEPVKKFNDDKIKVFPNPVTPGFTGFITLTGLENETVVKVTDASGRLVAEGTSNGGSFSWDGKHNGSYVGSGVYFFHLMNTDENNSRSSAAKVLIIR
ncbi:MAG: T9SS type A sorting domain-containing protein, partial [Paludibacteraceae bacterium]|nr:T9SS type A sorting domain-containing protein [Paludibacteraceae bacterium]